MKNKKTILITIFSIIIVVILGIGLYFFNSEKIYSNSDTLSSEDILEGVDFSAEGTTVELHKVDTNVDGSLAPIELTEKTQLELIKAFEKSKFKNVDSNSTGVANDYRMKMTLNRGYVMYLDIDKKGISVENTSDTSSKKYLFKDGIEFFSILEEAATE